MGPSRRKSLSAIFSAALLCGSWASASADPIADFYHSKTVTIVTGGGAGDLYDFVARLVAQHLGPHMPGQPAVVVQNMPGASSVRATDYAYNIASRDGLTLVVAQPYVVLNKLLRPESKYEPAKFSWIGRIAPIVQLGVVRTDTGVKSVEDLSQKHLSFGAGGSSGPAAMVPWMLDRMLGAKISVVVGYSNEAAYILAMINGEVQGLGSLDRGALVEHPELTTQKMVQPLYVIGLKRSPDYPTVPALVEFDKSGNVDSPIRLLASIPTLGLNVMGPPGLPPDRVAALRRAFQDMVRDPAFVTDAKKFGIETDPMTGENLEKLVSDVFAAPPGAIHDLQQYTKPSN
jgi:tripartite-type tricarboxylate transporter receptor subunit TctC